MCEFWGLLTFLFNWSLKINSLMVLYPCMPLKNTLFWNPVFYKLICVMVSGSWTPISECRACNTMTVSAVLSLQSRWVWKLWRSFRGNQDRDVKQAILNPNLKAGLGSCLESRKNWDWWDKRMDRRGNNSAVEGERLLRASAAAISIFCKGK